MAILRQFARLLDPNTGVREEEYHAMMKAAGILNTWNLFKSGQFLEGSLLTPQAAQQFVLVSDKIMARMQKRYDPAVRKYVMQLQSAGVDNPYDRLGLRPPTHDIEVPEVPKTGAKPSISALPPGEGKKTSVGDLRKKYGY
jgi:hypothetical protein